MGHIFSVALFDTAHSIIQQGSLADITMLIAHRVIGRRAVRIHQMAQFDECELYLFHSGPLVSSTCRGIAVAECAGYVIVVSDRCDEWLGTTVPKSFREVCTELGSEMALVLSINESVDSCAYMLWSRGQVVRLFANDEMEDSDFGNAPELERDLRAAGYDAIDIVDGMAQLFLPAPLTQFVMSCRFTLWGH